MLVPVGPYSLIRSLFRSVIRSFSRDISVRFIIRFFFRDPLFGLYFGPFFGPSLFRSVFERYSGRGSTGTGAGGVHGQRRRGNDLDTGERVREEHQRGARHVLPSLRRLPGAVLGELRQVRPQRARASGAPRSAG